MQVLLIHSICDQSFPACFGNFLAFPLFACDTILLVGSFVWGFSDCLVRVATEADSVHTAVRVLEALGYQARTVVFYVVYSHLCLFCTHGEFFNAFHIGVLKLYM